LTKKKIAIYLFYLNLTVIFVLFGGPHFYTKTLVLFLAIPLYILTGDRYKLPAHTKLFFILTVSLIIIQLIPLPQNLLKIISPGTYLSTIKPLENIGLILENSWHPISVVPANTLFYLGTTFTVFVFYYFAYTVISKDRDNFIFFILFSSGTILFTVLNEIIMKIFRCKTIYCFTLERKHHFGQFINDNFAADYFAMILFIVTAYAVSRSKYKNKIIFFILATTIYLSILITLSRASIIISSILLLFFFGKRIIKNGINKTNTIIIGLMTIIILSEIFFIHPKNITKELETARVEMNNPVVRKNIYQTTIEIFKDFPVLGSGLDTYREISPKYQQLLNKIWLTYSDSDWVQFTAEGGIIFFIIIITFLFSSARFQRNKKFPSNYENYIRGINYAMTFMMFHAFFAYPFYFPLTLIYFFTILGIRDGFIVHKQLSSKNQSSMKTRRI